jgi:hypothetical protein
MDNERIHRVIFLLAQVPEIDAPIWLRGPQEQLEDLVENGTDQELREFVEYHFPHR